MEQNKTSTPELTPELTKEQKRILDERYAEYKNNPTTVEDADSVHEYMRNKYLLTENS